MSVDKSPVYNVKAIPVEKIQANDYNPNVVAPPEMKLLELSIWEDGFTMPCVCYYDREKDNYILVDGYHRYQADVMMITIVLLVIIVCIIQIVFDHLASRVDKRNR